MKYYLVKKRDNDIVCFVKEITEQQFNKCITSLKPGQEGQEMNKPLLSVCFAIMTLSGFMFAYIYLVTGLLLHSYAIMLGYYLSLGYIVIQFYEKPKVKP